VSCSVMCSVARCGFCAEPSSAFVSTSARLVFRTANCGDSWTQDSLSAVNMSPILAFANDSVGLAVRCQNGIVRTTNAGRSWVPYDGSPSAIVNDVCFMESIVALAVDATASVWRSEVKLLFAMHSLRALM
jgi:photosystem II stability/assembly factor-like uncharacterized protein